MAFSTQESRLWQLGKPHKISHMSTNLRSIVFNLKKCVRNSWGEYWGNMGFFYVKKADNWDEPSPCGKDGCMSIELEGKCSWATIGSVTEMPSGNAKCGSAGQDCRTPTDPK